MNDQFDEKGKIFTNVVTKNPVPVIIQTANQSIHGEIYIKPESRLKDDLNSAEEFLAVTNAVVQDGQKQEVLRCSFLLVNRSQIIWLAPNAESTSRDPDLTI